MAIKLGELLLKEKLITPEQLDEALKSQMIFGIRLGSSLVELGFISDEQLCGLLSRKLGVPAVGWRDMSSVSPEVLALVPAELAGKYRVVPFKADGKKLSLAMADPTDFKAIDEVAFVTGCRILPHIVPDIRITSSLLKYYQIEGNLRYVRIEGELANKHRATLGEEAVKKSRKTAEPIVETVKKAENIEIPIVEAVKLPEKTENPMLNNNEDLLHIEIPPEFEGFANIPGYEDYNATEFGGIERYTVDRLSLEFASAKNRDQIAAVFIKYLGQEFKVGALFIIRNNMAVGWRGISSGKRIEELESLSILLSKPSVMSDVLETREFSMGTLIQTPENMQIQKTLGVGAGTPLLVLPIIMLKKVVAVVVVSAEMEALGKRLLELQKLVYKASLAFEMLIIKNKILMT